MTDANVDSSVSAQPVAEVTFYQDRHPTLMLTNKVTLEPGTYPLYAASTLPPAASQSSPASAEELARMFHDVYETLAPQFGYATRPETRTFDPNSANGRLMIAVCAELRGALRTAPSAAAQAVEGVTVPLPDILHRMKYHAFPADADGPADWELFDADIDCPDCIDVMIVKAKP